MLNEYCISSIVNNINNVIITPIVYSLLALSISLC